MGRFNHMRRATWTGVHDAVASARASAARGAVDRSVRSDLGCPCRPVDGRLVRSGGAMLSEFTPVPTLAVRNVEQARTFYEGVLGFTPVGDAPDGVMYRAGSSQILVYPSAYAGSNKATAVSFQVAGGEPGDDRRDLVGVGHRSNGGHRQLIPFHGPRHLRCRAGADRGHHTAGEY